MRPMTDVTHLIDLSGDGKHMAFSKTNQQEGAFHSINTASIKICGQPISHIYNRWRMCVAELRSSAA